MAKSGGVLRFQEHWEPASALLSVRQEPKFTPLIIPGLQRLLPHGMSRGIIAEINGRRSSGRTSACLSILAQATRQGEICAVIDLYDSFHPASAEEAGAQLNSIVWVRCRGNAEHALRTADLLLHAGGFGVILLDLCEAKFRVLNRIPLSYWHRFRLAIENTPTILLVCAETSQAKSSNGAMLEFKTKGSHWTGIAPFLLLRGLDIHAVSHKARRAISNRPAPVHREPVSIQTVA